MPSGISGGFGAVTLRSGALNAGTGNSVGNVFNPDWQGCPPAAMQKLGVSFAVMDSRIPVE